MGQVVNKMSILFGHRGKSIDILLTGRQYNVRAVNTMSILFGHRGAWGAWGPGALEESEGGPLGIFGGTIWPRRATKDCAIKLLKLSV